VNLVRRLFPGHGSIPFRYDGDRKFAWRRRRVENDAKEHRALCSTQLHHHHDLHSAVRQETISDDAAHRQRWSAYLPCCWCSYTAHCPVIQNAICNNNSNVNPDLFFCDRKLRHSIGLSEGKLTWTHFAPIFYWKSEMVVTLFSFLRSTRLNSVDLMFHCAACISW